MSRIVRNAVILLVLFVAGGATYFGWGAALSIVAGGVLSMINFHWMAAGVDRLIYTQDKEGIPSVLFKYLGRLLLIFISLFAIIHLPFLSLMGALLGFSVFVLSGMLEAILLLLKQMLFDR